MGKSIYRRYAAEYRLIAETACCEKHRAELLMFASEWEALADAAPGRSKSNADCSAVNTVAANYPKRAAA